MENTLVRRDQFNITPQGIVHKPTTLPLSHRPATRVPERCAWVSSAQVPNGSEYRAEDVQRMMREPWEEYLAKNPESFKA